MKLRKILIAAALCASMAAQAAAADFPALMCADASGRIAFRFDGGAKIEHTRVPVDALPCADAARVRQGITLPDQAAYLKAKEDFCS